MSKSSPSVDGTQHGRALSALNEIGPTLYALEDPTDILKRIVHRARDILGAEIVDLYEYHQTRNQFTLPPVLVGDRRDPHVPKLQIYEDDVVYKVVKAGEPQYFPDAQNDQTLTAKFEVPRADAPDNRFVIREGVRSSVSLPLLAGTETVGVMFVNYRNPQAFEREQKDLIESFSHLAAIAIYNSRLWKRQASQLLSLKVIIDSIGSENPLPAILQEAVSLIAANHGSISRLTEDGTYLQFQARWDNGQLLQEGENSPLQPLSRGITGHVVRTGELFRCGDVSQVEFYASRYPSTRSEMAIPLRNAFEGVIGVLNLESDYPDFFTEEHEKLCVSFAKAASAAIQQSDLIENVQSLHALTELHNINDLLERILKNLIKIMGANTAASVNLYDREHDNFYSFYGIGPNREFEEKYLLIPPRREGTGRHVLTTGEPLYYEDIHNIPFGSPPIRSEAWNQDIRSFAVLPLKYQDELLGTLFIHKFGEQAHFTDEGRRLLQTYTAQTALAIHNNRRRVEVEPLKDILNATVTQGREVILKLIVEKAVHIMASDYASIWLADRKSGDLHQAALFVKPGEEPYINSGHNWIRKNQASVNMNVFTTGQAVVISDVSEKETNNQYNRIYQKAKSEIAVPLVFQNTIIGTLNTESQYLGAFSELDMPTFRVFADIAATAIQVSQTLEELSNANRQLEAQREELKHQRDDLRKRTDDLFQMNFRLKRKTDSFEVLTEIGQELTANVNLDEQEILSIIHKQASKIMDTNNMFIALYDPQIDQVRFALASLDGVPVDVEHAERWQPRKSGRGRTEWIIRNREPILNYTEDDSKNWYRQPDAEEYIGETFASFLGVPIMCGDDVLGVIATYHRTEEYKYDPDDLKILMLMGRQAAIALQNSRLVRQLDRRITELDKIRELGEELGRTIS
jgi:GAF domain-containing protein